MWKGFPKQNYSSTFKYYRNIVVILQMEIAVKNSTLQLSIDQSDLRHKVTKGVTILCLFQWQLG